MGVGYIDNASLHGVIAALTYQDIESIPIWTSDAALATTALLATNPTLQVEVAASPRLYAGPRGLYDYMRISLPRVFFCDSKPLDSVLTTATKRVKRWVRRNLPRVKQIWLNTQHDPSFAKWLEWSIKYAWVEHTMMHGGLFDPVFVPELALILNTSETELYQILEISRDPREVQQWVRDDLNRPACELAAQAYALSSFTWKIS